MIYIFIFLISILLIWISNYFIDKDKKICIISSFLAVVVVALIAGARDYNIGTDTSGYANIIFNYAVRFPNIVEFYKHAAIWGDSGYLFLNYVVARFTTDPHVYYFILGFLMYGLTLWGLWKLSKFGYSITLAWTCYLFLFYADTLNAMRQMLACSIIFLAFSYFGDKKYIKYALLMLIALSCHKSALLGIAVSVVYFILQRKDKKSIRLLIVIGVFFLAVFYEYVAQTLMNVGIFSAERYTKYLESGIPFDLNALILRLPFLLLIYTLYKSYKGENKDEIVYFDTILMIMIADLILSQMRSIVGALYRISLYFGMYRCIGYSRIIYSQKKNNRIVLTIALFIYLVVLFVYQVIYKGNNEIFPYTSSVLGIN